MKERSKAERIELRKRKRRFLAFIIAMLIGCLPTATAFAAQVKVAYNGTGGITTPNTEESVDPGDNIYIDDGTWFKGNDTPVFDYYLDQELHELVGSEAGKSVLTNNFEYYLVKKPSEIGADRSKLPDEGLNYWKVSPGNIRVHKSGDTAVGVDQIKFIAVLKNSFTISYYDGDTQINNVQASDGRDPYKYYENTGKDLTKVTASKEGSSFEGWYDNKECTGNRITSISATDNSNKTFYAKFTNKTETCTVTFDANGHGTAPDPVKVNKGEKVNKPEDPTAEGWNFGGWFTDEDFQNEYDFNTPVEKSFTLYAFWTENQPDICTVYFYRNGHGRAPRPQNVEKGNKAEKPKDPSADGYDFGGWYEEKECRNKYDFNKPVTQDIDLYAKWTKNDDGSGHDDDDDDDDDDDKPFNPNPNALIAFYYLKNGTLDPKAKIGKEVQGAAANAAFKMAVPAGWKEAFTFSMSNEDKHTYTLKDGTIKLYVPEGFQKAGRKYAILAMGQNGAVKLLSDTDTLPYWITVNPNVEGYAFELIYMD